MTGTPQTARDDTSAIAAYAAGYQLDAVAAAAEWRFMPEPDRDDWRRIADGKARAEPGAGDCPHGDLAAEARQLRELTAEILADLWPEDFREGASEGLLAAQARVDGYRGRARIDSDGNLLQPGVGNEQQATAELGDVE